ncbi:MAG: efflux RND transporter periplasmic adaptor subunit [Lachnospiraceae bacterium]|nr:efflux RND transporter periplasmic adaptor subunit [Lachnospiraceae bacterium]
MSFRKYSGVILSVLMVPALTGCSLLPEEEVFRTTTIVKEYEGNEFSMTTVKRGDVKDYRNIPCEYRKSNIEDVVLAPWMGITDICVEVGDKVEPGDILVLLASEDTESNIDELNYQIDVKQTKIKQARNMCALEIKRQKLILDDKTTIKAIKEKYEAEISNIEGELSVLNAQLSSELDMQEIYQIKATISGTVTHVDKSVMGFKENNSHGPGGYREWVRTEKTVVSISDGSMPYFAAPIDSSEYIETLSEGDEITVTVTGSEYKTKVHFPKKDRTEVHFLLDYVPEDLDNGNLANAEYIIEKHEDVLYLPDVAVNKMGDKYVVYYEDENGLKSAQEITVGLMAENKVEIAGGLEFGDAVIVR